MCEQRGPGWAPNSEILRLERSEIAASLNHRPGKVIGAACFRATCRESTWRDKMVHYTVSYIAVRCGGPLARRQTRQCLPLYDKGAGAAATSLATAFVPTICPRSLPSSLFLPSTTPNAACDPVYITNPADRATEAASASASTLPIRTISQTIRTTAPLHPQPADTSTPTKGVT